MTKVYSVVFSRGRYDDDEIITAASRHKSLQDARRAAAAMTKARRANMARRGHVRGGFRVIADERAQWPGWVLDMISTVRGRSVSRD